MLAPRCNRPIGDFFPDPDILSFPFANEAAEIAATSGDRELMVLKSNLRSCKILLRHDKDALRRLWVIAVVRSDFF
jgi:hypothetical protein